VVWVKGYEYALHAVRMLLDRGIRVSYTIAGGDEGALASIRLAIRDFRLDDVVNLKGHLEAQELRDELGTSDVFVLSSVSEGSPVAILEAMAMGLPVVVTDVGGIRELVTDSVHGLVVPSRSAEALAAAVVSLQTAEQRRSMGEKGAAHALGFDAQAQIDRLAELYQSLTETPPLPKDTPDVELVSVVIVARNAAETIEDQLRALSLAEPSGRRGAGAAQHPICTQSGHTCCPRFTHRHV
jgi:glycosyltransferase involved in cell wall biosynthesis